MLAINSVIPLVWNNCMSEKKQPYPYRSLGAKLKKLREKLQETVTDVSGAVEIDAQDLARFELGKERPSEDILALLISHFAIKEDEAVSLWNLAGYERKATNDEPRADFVADDDRAPAMVTAGDVRIVYTDIVHVVANNYGVVLNFMQGGGPNNQPLIISRVGMSREHAASVLELLQRTLSQSEQKQLPESGTPKEDS